MASATLRLAEQLIGTSDGRFLKRICRELIEFGPVNESIHKIDEHIDIASLDVLKNVYRSTLEQLVAS